MCFGRDVRSLCHLPWHVFYHQHPIKPAFSYGFPMVFPWFSYGFPMKNTGGFHGKATPLVTAGDRAERPIRVAGIQSHGGRPAQVLHLGMGLEDV